MQGKPQLISPNPSKQAFPAGCRAFYAGREALILLIFGRNMLISIKFLYGTNRARSWANLGDNCAPAAERGTVT